jgi:uncharacterized protein YbjT (DUF2867 family)
MQPQTALVIGATGLVGSELLRQLLQDARFGQVHVFTRRSTGLQHPGLQEHIVDFDQRQAWQHLLQGDVLFSALGTTLRTAGSKEAQYKVDYTYQYEAAEAAARQAVPVYVLVSAAGASPDSRVFYSRMKGELERDVSRLRFNSVHLIRPGILKGPRTEERTGERIAIAVMDVLGQIPGLRPYRPIHARIVAAAMIRAALSLKPGIHRYTLEEVFKLAEG